MKPELDEQLCKKYPRIFRDRHGHMSQTAMCWGLAVGDGWYNILDNACWLIQNHIDHTRKRRADTIQFNRVLKRALKGDVKGLEWYHAFNNQLSDFGRKKVAEDLASPSFKKVPESVPQVVAVQVKEKFGGLRFYVNGGDDYCDGVIAMAEAMADCTCEECGNIGKKTGGGWIQTLCEAHMPKRDEDDYAVEDESIDDKNHLRDLA